MHTTRCQLYQSPGRGAASREAGNRPPGIPEVGIRAPGVGRTQTGSRPPGVGKTQTGSRPPGVDEIQAGSSVQPAGWYYNRPVFPDFFGP